MIRASAKFADPGGLAVTIILTGPLSDFEALRVAILESSIPYHRVSDLVTQINDTASKLRAVISEDQPA